MPKYLIEATYTAEGLRGLTKDKAGRPPEGSRKRPDRAVGGKLESMYFTFGRRMLLSSVIARMRPPRRVLQSTVGASGAVRSKTRPLLTIEEIDTGLSKKH